jgi:hypothetical protein
VWYVSFHPVYMCMRNCCQPTVKLGVHYIVALQSVLLVCKCLLCGVQTPFQLCVTNRWSPLHLNKFGGRY